MDIQSIAITDLRLYSTEEGQLAENKTFKHKMATFSVAFFFCGILLLSYSEKG